jgi:predicted XRE-type DNA-binding protein
MRFTTLTSRRPQGARKARVSRMAKSFDELVKRATTPKTRRRAATRARELLGELLLSEIRERAGKSQRQVAEALGIKQPSLSKLERQSDMQISTLRRIVNALGGELEVVARFPEGTVKIEPFNETSGGATVSP